MKKSKVNSGKTALTLIVTTGKDYDDSIIGNSTMADDHIYEFYLEKKTVIPTEIVSIKYPTTKCEDNSCRNRLVSRSRINIEEHDNFVDFFLKINAKTVDDLLNDLFPERKPTDDSSAQSKYDVGSHIPFSRDNIISKGYEIELSESQTFSILDLPGSVSVKGDGDYDRIQNNNDFILQYKAKLRVKVDSIAQTINSFTEREDKDCQTMSSTMSMIGTQVHEFNIIDAALNEANEEQNLHVEPLLTKTINISNVKENPELLIENALVDKTMFIERILAQNTFGIEQIESNEFSLVQVEQLLSENEFFLKYCFTLKLDNINKSGLPVKCMHWNESETHLLAVAYSKSIYDFEYKLNSVAVWSTKNPYTPERYYELSESAITCLKFSNINPNRLAIGFYSGEILIINISNKNLDIVYQKSKQLPLDTNGVLDVFWTVQTENELGRNTEYECLVTCNFNGRITHYRHLDEAFEEKTIMQLSQNDDLIDGDNESFTSLDANTKRVFSATKFIGLNQIMYLVGTGDGLVYTCSYDNSMKHSTKIVAHFGMIKSLEKSPFSRDVFLTTGCDCSINIWIGDIFIEPVMTLNTEKQIEKAIWSRTNSTIIAAIVEHSILIWDIEISNGKPIMVQEQKHSDHRWSGIEFTLDGKYLCVSDTSGKIIIYTWNVVSISKIQEHDILMYCVAKSLYGKQFLPYTLCKARPEYFNVFSKLYDEKQKTDYT